MQPNALIILEDAAQIHLRDYIEEDLGYDVADCIILTELQDEQLNPLHVTRLILEKIQPFTNINQYSARIYIVVNRDSLWIDQIGFMLQNKLPYVSFIIVLNIVSYPSSFYIPQRIASLLNQLHILEVASEYPKIMHVTPLKALIFSGVNNVYKEIQ